LKSDNTLTNFEEWTLRVRPGTGTRILLLLHGWTGDEDSMSIFTRNLPKDYWIISPRAPYPTLPSGYSWRAPAPRGSRPSIDLFRPSVDALIKLLDHWSIANNLETAKLDVVGFSQGGALTFTFGALHPELVMKMGILAGFAPEGAEAIMNSNSLRGKTIFVAHGSLDETVPIAMVLRTIQILESAGAQVSFCQSKVGHKLSAECLKALECYLAD
jgi:phospholipase/carboxylesterase